jgi:hypothetical protein
MALSSQVPTIASAATLTIPDSPNRRFNDETIAIGVTGTADITSITAMRYGTRLLLIFTGTAATNGVVDGSNLAIAGNFAYTPDDTLELWCDGVTWYQIGGRAAN